jgi:hypothetical protein
MGDSNAVDVRRVADQIAARTGWLLVYRAPEANSGIDGQSTKPRTPNQRLGDR